VRTDNLIDRFTCVFSVLIAVSLVMSILVLPSFSSAGPASAETGQTIIVQGENAYSRNQIEDSLQRKYEPNKPSSTAVSEKAGPTGMEPQLGRLSENIQSEKNLISHNEGWDNFTYIEDPAKLVIGVNADYAEVIDLIVENGGKLINTVSIKGEVAALVADIPLNVLPSFVTQVRASNLVRYIEPDMKVHIQLVPNDPYWSLQWGPQKIGADLAWDTTVGSHDVLVAVVDTGIDYNHPDLAANYVPLGYDWVNMDNDPMDDHGHGTHCAGIIAAVLNNGIGIAGLAQARVMAEKVLTSGGWGYWDWIANGIVHAADQGADIISMSLGGYEYSELLHEAVKYAYDSGVLLVAAAGNDATSIKSYPAAYDEVIAVAATDNNDYTAWWSNWGDWIELAAPGVDIYSTVPWGYESWSGTSMAAPHVSGVTALVRSLYPDKSRDWVRLWLRYTGDDLGDPGFDVYYGYGRINARKAVEEAPPAHDLIAYEWVTPPYVEPGASEIINATIFNFGENDENDIVVQLLVDNTIVDSTLISFLASGDSTTVDLLWNPTVEGLYTVTLYVVPVPGETNIANNVLSKYIYVGFPVKAVVLHSAGNIFGDIIANWQVLNSEWYRFGDNMIYIDYTTLNIEGITYENIVATEADVLIISCAYSSGMGWEFTDSEIEAIERYVREGHGLIATAGTLYYGVPNNNKLAPLFGLNETTTWNATMTDLLHLLDNTHPLFRNVPNPFVFADVGTAIPSDWRWDLNELVGGEYLALGHYRESAIVTFRGLVYISPWLEVIPSYYHHHLQLLYNAIMWSRYERPEHELIVSLEAPARLNPGESTLLNATVSNKGKSDERNVELQLFIDNMIVDDVTISELPVDSSYTLSYLWTPTVQKMYDVTAYAPPIVGEEFTRNNVATKMVMVLFIVVEKVLVYTDDAYVTPSSRYPIVALNNLGINYTHYFDDPWGFGAALTSQPWDLVIVDHCNYFAIGNYWTELDEYVRNGGLLVLSTFDIDGSHSEPTTLWNTLGVRWISDMWWPEPVYRWVPSHPIFTFPNTVGDLTSYIEGYWDDGDHVAVTTGTPIAGFTTSPEEDYAGIVVGNTYPTVLFSFILDEFRYDQDGDGKLDAIELWEDAIVYLARGYEHDLAVSLEAPKSLKLGTSALLNATVRNRGLNDENDVELQLLIDNTLVDSVIPELLVGESYTIDYTWTPTRAGGHNITAYAPPVPGEEYVANNVVTKWAYVFTYTRLYLPHEWVGGGDPMGWHADDGSWEYTLSFDFPFYGTNYRKIYISSNGLITFIGPDTSYSNSISALAGKLAIAPAWDDWVTYDPYDIFIWENSTHVGIRWYVRSLATNMAANFEAILREDGVIQFNYDYNEGPISATIGISNGVGHILAEDVTDLNYINTIVFLPFQLEHDLAVSLEAPKSLKLGTSALLNATVRNRGLNDENNVELQLLIDNAIVDSVIIPELLTGSSYTLSYLWTPTLEGTYEVKAYAPPVPYEEYIQNNVSTRIVTVMSIPRLLVIDTPTVEDTGALDMLGYEYTVVTPIDFATVDLYQYDILFVGWMPGDTVVDALIARGLDIASWVSAGNGIVALAELDEFNKWAWLPLWVYGSSGFYADTVHILNPAHPVMSGLTDAELSGWGNSYHACFIEYDPAWEALAEGVEAAQPITLATTYDAGRIVITNQDPDYHLYYEHEGGAEKLLRNMIEWVWIKKYGVDVSVSPSYQSGLNGATLDYIVTVSNTGNVADTYSLTATDDAGWSPSVSPASLTMPPRENRTATLTVTVPLSAIGCTSDNVTVTATGTGVSDLEICIAHAMIVRGVEVSISPVENSGPPGTTVTFTVTVKNEGNVSDTYSLTTADNAGWGRTISPSSLSLAAGAFGTTTLTVTIPTEAENCMRDIVTVTATSQTEETVSNSASCIAHATAAPPPPPGIEWDASITATFSGGSDDAIFGVRLDATSGFDSKYDIPEPPALPEPPYVRAYFYYPEQVPDELHRSCLKPENLMEWPLGIEYSEGPTDITLTWSVENSPTEYSVLLYRGGDLIADMRAEDYYTFEASAGSYDFKIIVGKLLPFTLKLTQGWNMISFPILLENMNPDSIFGGYYVLYRWDAENKRYVLHADSGSFIEPDPDVEVGVGYWVYVLEDENVNLLGVPVNQLTLSLRQGWNLIGTPYGGSSIADPIDDPDNSVLPWAFTWNAHEKKYDMTQLLDAGKGYWVYAFQGCELKLIGGK